MKRTSEISNVKALRFMLGFVHHIPLYLFAMFLYTSQQLSLPMMLSVLLSGLTAAMTGGGYPVLVATALKTGGFLVFLVGAVGVGALLYTRLDYQNAQRIQTKLLLTFMRTEAEDREHTGQAMSAMNTDAQSAGSAVGDALLGFVMWALPIAVFSVILFTSNWKIGLYTIIIGVLSLCTQLAFAGPLGKIAQGRLALLAKAMQTIRDAFSGAIVIRVFHLEDKMDEGFSNTNGLLLVLGRREATLSAGQKFATGISSVLTVSGVFAVGSFLISRGELTLVALLALVPLCENLATGIQHIGNAWVGMAAPLAAAKRVYAVLSGNSRLIPTSDVQYAPQKRYDIKIENLTFTYKGNNEAVLKAVSLFIPENEFVGLVGESGSGKSTLAKVIAGFYLRDLPCMSIGDIAFSKDHMGPWRANFAYVDQNSTLFNMTIAENIALGKPGATLDEVIKAASQASADGFICALPNGYDTLVGEAGSALSGGQRQRIAIARALIRRAPVLVFDEITSALDAENEAEVVEAIRCLQGSHTIIMVTHNLSSISPDTVYQVVNGRVVIESR